MEYAKAKRILIVDDDPDFQREYATILSPTSDPEDTSDMDASQGTPQGEPNQLTPFSLDFASTGQEAVSKAQEGMRNGYPFAMAFVERQFSSGWDGVRTTEELWKLDPRLQVVVCSAFAQSSTSEFSDSFRQTNRLLLLKKPFCDFEIAQLATALTEKWELARLANVIGEDLEQLIRKRTNQLKLAALHDPLTDLPNRRLFRIRLSEAVRDYRGTDHLLSIVLLDLDRFKQVNDTYGHPVGDELLIEFAQRLQSHRGNHDTLARLGGDEFALILCGRETVEAIKNHLEGLAEHLREPYSLSSGVVTCPASFGLAILPAHGTHPDDLVCHADLALYRAKREGRNAVRVYDPLLDSQIIRTRQLESELVQAMEANEFQLRYQPIMKSDSGKPSAVEVLIRWQNPKRGHLLPADFIPLAEKCGLVSRISEWVIQRAFEDAAQWPSDIRLAINISAAQLRKKHEFVQSIVKAATRADFPTERLELEITESVLLIDSDETHQILHALRGIGVQIVLDDFGMGYSSLNYLRRFPFSKIKLDQVFISNMSYETADTRIIVRAVAELGRKLKIETTAEGVETAEQLEIVIAEGFDYWQGFLKSQPLPNNELLLALQDSQLPPDLGVGSVTADSLPPQHMNSSEC